MKCRILSCALVCASVVFGETRVRAQATPGTAKEIINRLATKPTQVDAESAAAALALDALPQDRIELEVSFNNLLTNEKTSDLAWAALSHHRIPHFNDVLAQQLYGPGNLDNTNFIQALKNSDANLVKVQLLELGLSRGSLLTADLNLAKALNVAIAIDPVFSLAAILKHFTPPGRASSLLDDFFSQKIVEFLKMLSFDRDIISATMPQMVDFVIGGTDHLPLSMGTKGGPRYWVVEAIENLLAKQHTPLAESALLLFADSDSTEMAARAATCDYAALKAAPWLIPSKAWGVWLTPLNDHDKQFADMLPKSQLPLRCTNAITLISSWEVHLPADEYLSFDYLQRFKQSNPRWAELGGKERSAALLTNVVDEQYALLKSLIHAIDSVIDPPLGEGTVIEVVKRCGTWFGLNIDQPGFYGTAWDCYYKVLYSAFDNKSDGTNILDNKFTAGYLIQAELARRALLLYAVTSWYRNNALPQASLPNISDIDDRVAALINSSRLPLKTDVISEASLTNKVKLSPKLLQRVQGTKNLQLRVQSRELSFATDTYHERLQFFLDNGKSIICDWVGDIPLSLVSALRRQPRLLDLLNVSLAQRELNVAVRSTQAPWDDIDLVVGLGQLAIPYCQLSARYQDVPWQDVRDVLTALLSSAATEKFSMTLPGDITPLHGHDTPDVVSHLEFDRRATQLISNYTNYLAFREFGRLITALKETVNSLPEGRSVADYVDYVGTVLSSGFTRTSSNPKIDYKNSIIHGINDLIELRNAIAKDQFAVVWTFPTQPVDRIYVNRVITVVNPDVTAFVSIVMLFAPPTNYYYGAFRQELVLPPQIKHLLTRALLLDPYFLSRKSIDFGFTSDYGSRLLQSLAGVPTKNDRTILVQEAFQGTGMLPFVYTCKLESVGPASCEPFGDSADAWVDKTIIQNLLNARRAFKADQDLVERGLNQAFPDKYQDVPARCWPVSSNFFLCAVSNYASCQQAADSFADKQISEAIGNLKAHQDPPRSWSVAAFYGGSPGASSSYSFGLDFQYGQLGISTTWRPNTSLSIAGNLGAIRIPGLSIPLPYTPPQLDLDGSKALDGVDDGAISTRHASWSALAGTIAADVANNPESSSPKMLSKLTTLSWKTMPPIEGAGGGAPMSDMVTKLWLEGLVYQAIPRLTDNEWQEVQKGLSSPQFPHRLIEVLLKRGDQATKECGLQDVSYIRTDPQVRHVIPEKGTADEAISSACVDMSSPTQIDSYIKTFNNKSLSSFRQKCAAASGAGEANELFGNDGIPSQSLSYGNDCRIMLFRYDYRLRGGASLSSYQMAQTPASLVAPIRQDPAGHVFDKVYIAAADLYHDWPSEQMPMRGDSKSTVAEARAEASKVSALIGDEVAKQLMKDLHDHLTEYMKVFAAWQNGQAGTNSDAFVPPPLGSPFLSGLGTPFEWFQRKTDGINVCQQYQFESELYQQILNRDVNVWSTGSCNRRSPGHDWNSLLEYKPKAAVAAAAARRGDPVLTISDGTGESVNLDYWGVTIEQMPLVNGVRLTGPGFLDIVRRSFGSFIDPNLASFRPLEDSDAAGWNAGTPGTLLAFNIIVPLIGVPRVGRGAVVSLAENTPSYWRFITVGHHPVSGTREFGVRQLSEGRWELYTRGADRVTSAVDWLMSEQIFSGGEGIWQEFQDRIASYVVSNGGRASATPATHGRYCWNVVKP